MNKDESSYLHTVLWGSFLFGFIANDAKGAVDKTCPNDKQ